MSRLRFLLLLLTACTSSTTTTQTLEHEFNAMGTTIKFSIAATDLESIKTRLPLLENDIHLTDDSWNPWAEGALARVNKLLPYQGWFNTTSSIVEMIQLSQELQTKTDGLFNPAQGGLVKLWGFHLDVPPQKPPPEESIAQWLQNDASMEQVQVRNLEIKTANQTIQLDFGGLAKGYTADLMAMRFRDEGISNAIINLGGDLVAMGDKGDKPWHVGIRHPRDNTVMASIKTRGQEAVFTSGDYERFFVHEGKRYHHILDPRTGLPSNELMAVTVIHEKGAWADAAATALMVAGEEDWLRIASALELTQVMVVDSEQNILLTSALAKRLKFAERYAQRTKIVALP